LIYVHLFAVGFAESIKNESISNVCLFKIENVLLIHTVKKQFEINKFVINVKFIKKETI